jgi:hypothetical protein
MIYFSVTINVIKLVKNIFDRKVMTHLPSP